LDITHLLIAAHTSNYTLGAGALGQV